MELNVEKIDNEIKRMGVTRAWIAYQLKVSPQLVYYWLKTKSLKGAEPIAKLFKIAPKDLIK